MLVVEKKTRKTHLTRARLSSAKNKLTLEKEEAIMNAVLYVLWIFFGLIGGLVIYCFTWPLINMAIEMSWPGFHNIHVGLKMVTEFLASVAIAMLVIYYSYKKCVIPTVRQWRT
jgi:hypothetical protein